MGKIFQTFYHVYVKNPNYKHSILHLKFYYFLITTEKAKYNKTM